MMNDVLNRIIGRDLIITLSVQKLENVITSESYCG